MQDLVVLHQEARGRGPSLTRVFFACHCAQPFLTHVPGIEFVDCQPPDCEEHALDVLNRVAIGEYHGDIDAESRRRIKTLLQPWLTKLTEAEAEIVVAAVHAAGDFRLAKYIRFANRGAEALVEALSRPGCVVVTDVKGVACQLRTSCRVVVAVKLADNGRPTRAAEGVRRAAETYSGAVLAIGNAPTALLEALRHRWSAVVAAPVGFLNAARAKEEALKSGLPTIVVEGTRGGSGIAAAIVNAAQRLATTRTQA